MAQTHRFFQEDLGKIGERLSLSPANVRIARSVLRLRPGARVFLLNGQGEVTTAELIQAGVQRGWVQVLDRKKQPPLLPAVTLLQGMPKGDKSSWVVQKAVEWGVSRIVFFESRHSVSKSKKAEGKARRWKNVAIEGLRQSGNPFLPEISGPISLSAALSKFPTKLGIFFDEAEQSRTLRHVLENTECTTLTLAIGPEGGWSEEDRGLLKNAGFRPARLAPYILRTETAAVSALAATHTLL